MTGYSYANGRYIPDYKAKLSINDRSVHFADAVYEVITVYDYRLLFWKEHIIRLEKSLNLLDIKLEMDFDPLFFKCEELIKKIV